MCYPLRASVVSINYEVRPSVEVSGEVKNGAEDNWEQREGKKVMVSKEKNAIYQGLCVGLPGIIKCPFEDCKAVKSEVIQQSYMTFLQQYLADWGVGPDGRVEYIQDTKAARQG